MSHKIARLASHYEAFPAVEARRLVPSAIPMGHVWTAPGWQGISSRSRLGRSSHVFGLLARFT
jgi:hypothetical protein